MTKKQRHVAAISDVSHLLERLYEQYPSYRGTTPNKIFNIAVKDWFKYKLEI